MLSRLILATIALPAALPAAAEILTVCQEDCVHQTLRSAIEAASPGTQIQIKPGLYNESAIIRDDNITIIAEPGAHLTGAAAEEKAALVIKGNNTTIVGLECSRVSVPDGNGACIRHEGSNLTLRNVYFHDNEMGVLTGPNPGIVLVEDSILERNGKPGSALGHNIYVGGGEFIFRRSMSLASRNEGHEIKSRAYKTVIEESVVASLDGLDSRLIDVPLGGEVIIRNNLLQEGPESANYDLLGIGLESDQYDETTVLVEGNIIIADHGRARLIRSNVAPRITGNTLIGIDSQGGDNRLFSDRRTAGFEPYPSLAIPDGLTAAALENRDLPTRVGPVTPQPVSRPRVDKAEASPAQMIITLKDGREFVFPIGPADIESIEFTQGAGN